MIHRLLLDPQGGEGGGAPPVDPNEGFKALLAKHSNDALVVAGQLHAENYKLRQKNATLKAGVPGEGSVVLKGDDAKDWQKYRELGKPSEVKTSLESGRAAIEERDRFGRAEAYRKVAEREGLKPSVFGSLAERDGLVIEFVPGKEKGKDGRAIEVAVVKGEGDSTTPLNEYVDQHWSDFKPALGGESRDKKVLDATPPRRPFGMPAPDLSQDSRSPAEQALIRSGIYSAGL